MAARWNFNGEADSGGDEMGRRNGESGKRNSGADSFCCERGGVVGAVGARGGGGTGDTWSGFRRKKKVGPANKAVPPVSEGEAAGQAGPEDIFESRRPSGQQLLAVAL